MVLGERMKKTAQAGMGLVAAVIAFAVLGPAVALVVAWFIVSPDGVAQTARAGGAGALAAGASAGGKSLAEQWRKDGPARKRRRSERRDRWWAAGEPGADGKPPSRLGRAKRRLLQAEHGLILSARGVTTGVAAAALAAKAMPGAWRDAKAAVHARRNPGAITPEPEPDSGSEPDEEDDMSPQDRAWLARNKDAPAPAPTDSGDPSVAGQVTPPTTTGETVTEQDSNSNAGSSLADLDELDAWCDWMLAQMEYAGVLGAQLRAFETDLPEAYLAAQGEEGDEDAGPQTRALDEAIAAVGEAQDDPNALQAALNEVRLACDEAGAVGELSSSMGATGHTTGYIGS